MKKLIILLAAIFAGTFAMAQNSNSSKKILVAYFSWGGNTRGIAQEIAKQTGADIFEIEPKVPYSSNYNTVLKQAQEDQHKNARPELNATVKNFSQYDTIILGYPNWWASIPMPVATFWKVMIFQEKQLCLFVHMAAEDSVRA